MKRAALLLCLCALGADLAAENFRANVAGKIAISADRPEGASLSLSYVDSALIALEGDLRFLRGVELQITVPAGYLAYRGSLLVALYPGMAAAAAGGLVDLSGERAGWEPLPNKLQAIYQIPLRKGHNLKPSPYVSLAFGVVPPEGFPALFRLQPAIKGLPDDFEALKFQLLAKPILGEEGAVALTVTTPPGLRGRPFTLLIDDAVVTAFDQSLLLKEGDHFLAIVSDDYRNETRLFKIERAKVLPLSVELKDPTPVVTIEAPAGTAVFFDGQPIEDPRQSFTAPAGEHELRFEVGDYSVGQTVTLRQGRSYRIAMAIDVAVTESE